MKNVIFTGNNQPKDLDEVIGQCIGAASVCWESMDETGLFDMVRGAAIATEVVDWIETTYNMKPNLGLATTGELLTELLVRAEIGGYDQYRTVDHG